MAETHVTRELLLGVSRGELPQRFLAQVGLRHVLELCPYCRKEYESYTQVVGNGPMAVATEIITATLQAQLTRLERDHRQAVQDLRRLFTLPADERAGRVRRARTRFRGGHLAHLLLEKGQSRVTTDPTEAYHLAELARLVLQLSPFGTETPKLLALAGAALGNAVRAGGKLREAEKHFEHVRYLVIQYEVTDIAALARIDDLEGSLRKDQRSFGLAEDLLTRASQLYEAVGDRIEMARVLLKLGATYNLQGKTGRALEVTRAALEDLSPVREPRLYMNARYNLALYLLESGDTGQAAEVLENDADLHRQFPEHWVQLRLTWLRGRIAAARKDLASAEAAFSDARDGFLNLGIGYDAAMVSMDLAILYLRQGRDAELKTVASEMVPVFRTQDVHREALAALVLFLEAVREERVTTAFVRELTAYLGAARSDPSLRFRGKAE